MYIADIKIKNFRGIKNLKLKLNPDINIFVGENNSGKTSIIDAIRYTLETTPFIKIEENDFYDSKESFSIKLQFCDLNDDEKALLLEYVTYEDDGTMSFYLALKANKKVKNKWDYIEKEIKAGMNADISIDSKVREKIYSTYLKPLRDAEEELTSGRFSRLSEILNKFLKDDQKSQLNSNIKIFNKAIEDAQENKTYIKTIKAHLENLIFEKQNSLSSKISLTKGKDKDLFKNLLEKLNLTFDAETTQGLGYQNALYIAAELLLLNRESVSSFLLIEEPEAHLHPQLQMKFLKYMLHLLNNDYKDKMQVFITTHSPNIASKVNPEKIILSTAKNKKIEMWSLRKGETKLDDKDYIYLHKFLDVTKSNMFFAKGIIMVEGPSEEILIPAIAKAMDFNLEDYGVSIVNVNGVGFSRFSNIFKRENEKNGTIDIPISIITDLDAHRYLSSKTTNIKKVRGGDPILDIEIYRKKPEDQKTKEFISEYRSLEIDLLHSSLRKQFLSFIVSEKPYIKKFKDNESEKKIIFKCKDILKDQTKSKIFYKRLNNIKTNIAYKLSLLIEDDSSADLSKIPKYITNAIKYACGEVSGE